MRKKEKEKRKHLSVPYRVQYKREYFDFKYFLSFSPFFFFFLLCFYVVNQTKYLSKYFVETFILYKCINN